MYDSFYFHSTFAQFDCARPIFIASQIINNESRISTKRTCCFSHQSYFFLFRSDSLLNTIFNFVLHVQNLHDPVKAAAQSRRRNHGDKRARCGLFVESGVETRFQSLPKYVLAGACVDTFKHKWVCMQRTHGA